LSKGWTDFSSTVGKWRSEYLLKFRKIRYA
jgi:hypothetical protein